MCYGQCTCKLKMFSTRCLYNCRHSQLMCALHHFFITHVVEHLDTALKVQYSVFLHVLYWIPALFCVCVCVFSPHVPIWSTSWLRVVSYQVSVKASLPAAWEQSSSPAAFTSQPSKSTHISILMLAPFRLMNMVCSRVCFYCLCCIICCLVSLCS